MISNDIILNFPQANYDKQSPKNRYVLKLENQKLHFVSLKETSFFERVQSWFGFGPLSFANISDFISKQAQEIKSRTDISADQKKAFFKKAQHCCHSFNKHHSVLKVNQVAFENLLDASTVFYTQDATYNTKGDGICDVSYANGHIGFGYVADGTGHNNPMMAPVLNRVFANFNQQYNLAFSKAILNNEEDYKNFVIEQLTILGDAIHEEPEQVLNDPKKPGMTTMSDGTLKPAFSFAQVVKLGDKRLLITTQFSDTMLLIKKSDETFDTSLAKQKTSYGLGERHYKIEKNISVTQISPGDVIFGFSDGIGEFLTMDECQEVILVNEDPALLLSELKAKIIENGKDFVQDENEERLREKSVSSANGQKSTKFHLFDNTKFHDDIGMFRLSII